ncbi:DUF6296 family protein [Streptacidiphilus sp. N1-12]|uniref:DUF6296 family protein n=2 Tax=Streptacidiphilus alkalitolerans TaxID=3342712 RepID=A0ABV6WH61_9ACTN
MTTHYELTFPVSALDRTPATAVIVRRTAAQGPGGHPIYSDETGAVRAEISDRGECRVLATGVRQRPRRPISCRPLPSEDSAVAA